MALINCPECGKETSDQAGKCPNCGFPVTPRESGENRLRRQRTRMRMVNLLSLFIPFIAGLAMLLPTCMEGFNSAIAERSDGLPRHRFEILATDGTDLSVVEGNIVLLKGSAHVVKPWSRGFTNWALFASMAGLLIMGGLYRKQVLEDAQSLLDAEKRLLQAVSQR